MALSQSDRRRGFKEADEPLLKYFRSLARERGVSDTEVQRYESQYLDEHKNWRSPHDAHDFLRNTGAALKIAEHTIDEAVSDAIDFSHGFNLPFVQEDPMPSHEAAQRELAQINETMRTNRREYDRQNMGDRAIDLHRLLGDDVDYRPELPSDSAARDARLREIQGVMRTDKAGYFKNEALQAEYRQLIETRSAPESPAGADAKPAGGGVVSAPPAGDAMQWDDGSGL